MAAETRVMLDASYLVAAANERDVHHPRAMALQKEIGDGAWQPLLLDYVAVETVNVLLGRRGPEFAKRVARHLQASAEIQWLAGSSRLDETLDEFQARAASGLSLTDCAIVAHAKALKAPRVATFDKGLAGVRGLRVVP